MDYSRVYRDFISDRRKKEIKLISSGLYYEKHHIIPKSLGGDNKKTNIVCLIPEDHFFAHLLLAKIHGGKMWSPIAFMVGGDRKNWNPCKSRREYGWAIRELAKSKKGEGAYQFDKNIYELEHRDFRKWSGKQSEFPSIGINKSLANMLIKGRISTAKGWYISGNRPELFTLADHIRKNHPMKRRELFIFIHKSGETFIGDSEKFRKEKGVSKACTSRLINNKQIQASGWKIKGANIKRKPDPKRTYIIDNGINTIIGTCDEISKILDKSYKSINVGLSRLYRGHISSYLGYRIKKVIGGKKIE